MRDLKIPKGHLQINWPLTKILHIICAINNSLVIHIKNFLCHKFDSSVKFLDDGRAVGAGGGMASPDYDRSVKWGTDYTHYITKGQLISKCLFGVFSFFQKTNKNKLTWGIIAVKLNSFVRYLEVLLSKKSLRLFLTFSLEALLTILFIMYLLNFKKRLEPSTQ